MIRVIKTHRYVKSFATTCSLVHVDRNQGSPHLGHHRTRAYRKPYPPSLGPHGTIWLGLENCWLRGGGRWLCGELAAGLLPEEEAPVREIEAVWFCCWVFIGDLGLRASTSGVVWTRWVASGGGFRPPLPCQTLPSLSTKFLRYAYHSAEESSHEHNPLRRIG